MINVEDELQTFLNLEQNEISIDINQEICPNEDPLVFYNKPWNNTRHFIQKMVLNLKAKPNEDIKKKSACFVTLSSINIKPDANPSGVNTKIFADGQIRFFMSNFLKGYREGVTKLTEDKKLIFNPKTFQKLANKNGYEDQGHKWVNMGLQKEQEGIFELIGLVKE